MNETGFCTWGIQTGPFAAFVRLRIVHLRRRVVVVIGFGSVIICPILPKANAEKMLIREFCSSLELTMKMGIKRYESEESESIHESRIHATYHE